MSDDTRTIETGLSGDDLRRLRLSSGLRQSDVARELHVTRQLISRYERGELAPSAHRLKQLLSVMRRRQGSGQARARVFA